MTLRKIPAVLVVTLALGEAAAAQPPDPNKPQFALGLAAISSPEPYKGASDDLLVVPAISFSYKRFYFRGITAGYRLFDAEGFQADVIARARFGGFDEDDSPFLAGMEPRRKSADGGFVLTWERERFGLRLTPLADLLGRSGGQEVSFEAFVPLRRGPFRLEPSVGAVWQSASFVDYYAGVRPEEARPGRPAYEGEGAFNLTAGLSAFAPVTRKIVFQGFVKAERLAGSIADSPIVEDDLGWVGFAALSYQF
ncbi:MAG TPA: MipA/OmpV family protein [Acidobacteria bacterium]|nr:MipA/OmpV family protein [Acidobacteriota bacterium]